MRSGTSSPSVLLRLFNLIPTEASIFPTRTRKLPIALFCCLYENARTCCQPAAELNGDVTLVCGEHDEQKRIVQGGGLSHSHSHCQHDQSRDNKHPD